MRKKYKQPVIIIAAARSGTGREQVRNGPANGPDTLLTSTDEVAPPDNAYVRWSHLIGCTFEVAPPLFPTSVPFPDVP